METRVNYILVKDKYKLAGAKAIRRANSTYIWTWATGPENAGQRRREEGIITLNVDYYNVKGVHLV